MGQNVEDAESVLLMRIQMDEYECAIYKDGEKYDVIEQKGCSAIFVYRPPMYYGSIAINAIPSVELKNYHRNSKVQINFPNTFLEHHNHSSENRSSNPQPNEDQSQDI